MRRIYGQQAERIDPDQLLLFAREILAAGGDATTADPATPPDEPAPSETTAATIPPKKQGHGRKPLPAHLRRKPVVYDVPEEQKTCPDCGTARTASARRSASSSNTSPPVSSWSSTSGPSTRAQPAGATW